MSYKESEVKIVNHLSKILDGTEIIFYQTKDMNINDIQEIEITLTLDVVYLKKNIKIDNKFIKEDNYIKVIIEKFPLDKENDSDLMNIATLNFIFNDKNKKIISEKKLIVQIFREKTDIYKNII